MFAEVSSNRILPAFHSRNGTYKQLFLKTIFQNETDPSNSANNMSSCWGPEIQTTNFSIAQSMDDIKELLNHRIVWAGRNLKNYLVPSPCHKQDTLH